MSVFKTYDIRGIYGEGITADLAYRVGRAFAGFLGVETFVVGHDARVYSPELYEAVVRGLAEAGKNVTGIGLASTPYLHFTQIDGGFGGAVMVTASHNPPPYHGFKLFDPRGGSVSYAKGLDRIEAAVMGPDDAPPVPGGSIRTADPLEAYIDFVASAAGGEVRGVKVVIDVGNGSAGRVFRRLAERIGLDAVLLNEEPDGRFPNRDPNPLKPESRRACAERVRETGADVGVVLDGDGDRILFVDDRGESIENYFLSALIAEEMLSRHPGATIVYDLISSRALPEHIEKLGGKARVSRVGYTFVYDAMVETRAVFGTETSGHVYFKVSDTYYTESAAYALVILLRLLARRGEKLSAMVAPLKGRYAQSPELNIEMPERNKEEALSRVRRKYAGGKLDTLDGISVSFPDFWFNVRASNTEPLLRLRLEGAGREVVERRTEELLTLLEDLQERE